MELEPLNGSISKFITIDKVVDSQSGVPWYKTFGAIYHDT